MSFIWRTVEDMNIQERSDPRLVYFPLLRKTYCLIEQQLQRCVVYVSQDFHFSDELHIRVSGY